jgi:hypothetical protein
MSVVVVVHLTRDTFPAKLALAIFQLFQLVQLNYALGVTYRERYTGWCCRFPNDVEEVQSSIPSASMMNFLHIIDSTVS